MEIITGLGKFRNTGTGVEAAPLFQRQKAQETAPITPLSED